MASAAVRKDDVARFISIAKRIRRGRLENYKGKNHDEFDKENLRQDQKFCLAI